MRHIVIGTAGHIDHGKSALVMALTGTDPDRLKEEKARGITIDLGFAHTEIAGVRFAFVDVPGHERFVKNMLAGASGIAAVMLVVAADESVMPQTREHFDICRLLRVPAGVVALTKSDLVDEGTLDVVRLEVRELVAGSFLEGAPVLAVSSKTRSGLEELRAALAGVAAGTVAAPARGVARMPIDRAFTMKGFGTVVTGTVVSGRLAVDQELTVLPGGRRVKVRGLEVHGETVPQAVAGQRLAANLAGVEVAEVGRGAVLVSPDALDTTRRFDAIVELLPGVRPLGHGARVRFHQGTSELLGRVSVSEVLGSAPTEAGAVAGSSPSEIPAGGRAYVRVRLEAPAVLTRGDRFILRAYSPPVTIGGGAVLDPMPARGGVRTPAARSRFALLDPGTRAFADGLSMRAAIEQALGERGSAGVAVRELVSRMGCTPEGVESAIEALRSAGRAERLGDVLVGSEVLESLEAQLLEALGEYHRAEAHSDGLPREEARVRLFTRAHPAVFERVVRHLADRGAVVARDRLALTTHRVSLAPEEADALRIVEDVFLRAGLRPPDPSALAVETGLGQPALDRALRVLQRQRTIVRLETLWFHADSLAKLKGEIVALKSGSAEARLDVAAFKQLYGVSRKYAIPLLEYLDRERVTRRVGETRVVL